MASNGSLKRKIKGLKIDAHVPGLCSIAYDATGDHIVTAGADGLFKIFNVPDNRDGTACDAIVTVEASKNARPLGALAISPRGDKLATGSLDHQVKIWSCPSGEFISTFARCQLPIRALAFNRTGSMLAVGGDEGTIKILDLTDPHAPRLAWNCNQVHPGSIISLTFDPTDAGLLASVDTEGTVIISDVVERKVKTTIKRMAPATDLDEDRLVSIAWQPGDFAPYIAVPDRAHQVLLIDRDSHKNMKEDERMTGAHTSNVALVSWSPNGLYLATAGIDGQVLVWNAKTRQDIASHRVSSQVCGLDWKPNGNAIAMVDVDGRMEVWEGPVLSHMPSPWEGAQRHAGIDRRVVEEFDDDKDEMDGNVPSDDKEHAEDLPGFDDSMDAEGQAPEFEASDSEGGTYKRKGHLSKKKARNGSMAETGPPDTASEGASPMVKESSKPQAKSDKELGRGHKEYPGLRRDSGTPMQPPFQPGATEAGTGKKRFLAYNLLGCITTREEEGFAHVEIDFHDTNMGVRVPPMTDYYGFSMAALCEKGSVFANPKRGEKSPSTLLYRPFNSWASNTEWSMRFSGEEEVKSVAVGKGWAAASTSLHLLRIFSEAGIQRSVHSLPGPVVSMAGHEHLLALCYHAGAPLPSGDQVLALIVYDIHQRRKVAEGRMTLSPSATLAWLGFSEAGVLSTFDSQGILRIYSSDYGGCWIPIFSSTQERKNSGECHWVVGLNDTQLFVVVCKLPDSQPQVMPRPVHTILEPSIPLAYSDLGADSLEKDLVRKNMLLSQSRGRADEALTNGKEDEEEEEKILSLEADQDRCILRLIAAACKADKLARAFELATLLTLHRSLEGAVRLVSSMRLPALAEKLNNMLEKRLREEEASAAAAEAVELQASPPPCLDDLRQPHATHSPHTPDGSLRDVGNGPGLGSGLPKMQANAGVASRPPSGEEATELTREGLKKDGLSFRQSGPRSNLSEARGATLRTPEGQAKGISDICRGAHTVRGQKENTQSRPEVSGAGGSPAREKTRVEPAEVSAKLRNPFAKPGNPFAKGVPTNESGEKHGLFDSIKKLQTPLEQETAKRKLAATAMPETPSNIVPRPFKAVKTK